MAEYSRTLLIAGHPPLEMLQAYFNEQETVALLNHSGPWRDAIRKAGKQFLITELVPPLTETEWLQIEAHVKICKRCARFNT